VFLWVSSAEHPLVKIIGNSLTVEHHSAISITREVSSTTWSIEVPVVSIFNSGGLIRHDLVMRVVVEALRGEVWQVVGLPIVVFTRPDSLIVLIGVIKVKSVGLVLNREHGVWIEVDNVE
jgi:hypothetical protein